MLSWTTSHVGPACKWHLFSTLFFSSLGPFPFLLLRHPSAPSCPRAEPAATWSRARASRAISASACRAPPAPPRGGLPTPHAPPLRLGAVPRAAPCAPQRQARWRQPQARRAASQAPTPASYPRQSLLRSMSLRHLSRSASPPSRTGDKSCPADRLPPLQPPSRWVRPKPEPRSHWPRAPQDPAMEHASMRRPTAATSTSTSSPRFHFAGASPTTAGGACSTATAAHLRRVLIIFIAIGLHRLDVGEKGKGRRRKRRREETKIIHLQVGSICQSVQLSISSSSACHVCETAIQNQPRGLSEWFRKVGGVRYLGLFSLEGDAV
jgi:hypothetical protein